MKNIRQQFAGMSWIAPSLIAALAIGGAKAAVPLVNRNGHTSFVVIAAQ